MMKRYGVKVTLINPGFVKTPMTDQNNFKMPLIKSPEYAAEKMFSGLTKSKKFEIHFPKSFTTFMKMLKIMPYWKYFFLVNLLNKFARR